MGCQIGVAAHVHRWTSVQKCSTPWIWVGCNAPRDEHEVTVCRSLFWISYNFSLSERRKNSAEWNALWFGAGHPSDIEEGLAVAI